MFCHVVEKYVVHTNSCIFMLIYYLYIGYCIVLGLVLPIKLIFLMLYPKFLFNNSCLDYL